MEPIKTVDWQELATTSHDQTAVAIREALQEGNVAEKPRFTKAYIQERLWNRCTQMAVKEAERDMNEAIPAPPPLNWQDVFETDYQLDPTSQQCWPTVVNI